MGWVIFGDWVHVLVDKLPPAPPHLDALPQRAPTGSDAAHCRVLGVAWMMLCELLLLLLPLRFEIHRMEFAMFHSLVLKIPEEMLKELVAGLILCHHVVLVGAGQMETDN